MVGSEKGIRKRVTVVEMAAVEIIEKFEVPNEGRRTDGGRTFKRNAETTWEESVEAENEKENNGI